MIVQQRYCSEGAIAVLEEVEEDDGCGDRVIILVVIQIRNPKAPKYHIKVNIQLYRTASSTLLVHAVQNQILLKLFLVILLELYKTLNTISSLIA